MRRRIGKLPLIMLALTSRCNSRCSSCSYWKSKPVDFPRELVPPLIEDLTAFSCRSIGFTGGEPLLHPQFPDIFEAFSNMPQSTLFIMSNGTTLEKLNEKQLAKITEIFISLDGNSALLHNHIRGVDCYSKMIQGIEYVREIQPDLVITARCTIQKENWRYLRDITELAKESSFSAISFVAVDSFSQAYGREYLPGDETKSSIAANSFSHEECTALKTAIPYIISELIPYIKSGFIRETSKKLNEILSFLAADENKTRISPPACNSPYFSVFISEQGSVAPCFFRPAVASLHEKRLTEILGEATYYDIARIDGTVCREFCTKCTCSFFSGPHLLKNLFMP